MPTVPALVREADDRDTLLLGLVENVAREQLSAVEEARAYALLLDEFELSLGEVAERVGRSKPSVSNRLRLLELPDDVLGMRRARRADRGPRARGARRPRPRRPPQARPRDRPQRHVGARRRASCALGRREAEAAQGAEGRPGARRAGAQGAERATGFPARIVPGRLEIAFADEHELAELAEALERIA